MMPRRNQPEYNYETQKKKRGETKKPKKKKKEKKTGSPNSTRITSPRPVINPMKGVSAIFA